MNHRITEIRERHKLKKSDFAKKIGISPSAIGYIESGEKDPSIKTIQKICKEFNIDANWLIMGIESESITEKEKNIIKKYRNLNTEHQISIEEMIDTWQIIKEPYKKTGNL